MPASLIRPGTLVRDAAVIFNEPPEQHRLPEWLWTPWININPNELDQLPSLVLKNAIRHRGGVGHDEKLEVWVYLRDPENLNILEITHYVVTKD